MKNQTYPDTSSRGEVHYKDVLTTLIKRFGRLVGLSTVLQVARKIPELTVDDDGNVLAYDTSSPLGTVTTLIDEFEALYGELAHTLAWQVSGSLTDSGDRELLPNGDKPQSPQNPTEVLIVDDHVLFRQGLVSLLVAQPDVKVVGQAGTISEAVALARKLKPQLVLMDLTLPDGNGVDAIRPILADSPDMRVIVLTIHEDEEHVFEAVRAGAIGYLVKNVRVEELLATLRGVMRGEAGVSGGVAQQILKEFARLSPQPGDEAEQLTPRELEVLGELVRGATNQEIASRLLISENTVINHVRNVFMKLNLHTRQEAADYARRRGLINPPAANSSKAASVES